MDVDRDWLNSVVRYEIPGGRRLEGCLGVGGTWAVFGLVEADGRHQAVSLQKELFLFPSLLKQVANWFAPAPRYDVGVLNETLSSLIGDVRLALLAPKYRRIYDSLVGTFLAHPINSFASLTGVDRQATGALSFLLASEPMIYLLDDAAGKATDEDIRSRAASLADSARALPPLLPELHAASLLDNPLFVWGGACISGYFTRSEMPSAGEAVIRAIDSANDSAVGAFLGQALVVLDALEQLDAHPVGLRLLYDATDLFDVRFATDEEWAAPDHFIHLRT